MLPPPRSCSGQNTYPHHCMCWVYVSGCSPVRIPAHTRPAYRRGGLLSGTRGAGRRAGRYGVRLEAGVRGMTVHIGPHPGPALSLTGGPDGGTVNSDGSPH